LVRNFAPHLRRVHATAGTFHRDPADQIIVATARVLDVPLVTVDAKMLGYPHVQLAPTSGLR
jgi:PIN domain nuclease of toxin-antitoxin system